MSAQVRVDSLPCDAWLAAIARGVSLINDWDVLYKVDGCERPDSVVVDAREQGVRALLLLNDAQSASLYISYLARDSAWVANLLVPLILPIVTDKTRAIDARGRLMLLLASKLRPRVTAVKAVYNPGPGETPGTSAKCRQGGTSGLHAGSALSQTVVNSVSAAAQTMIADSTEVPQLRAAARCLLRAANDPDR